MTLTVRTLIKFKPITLRVENHIKLLKSTSGSIQPVFKLFLTTIKNTLNFFTLNKFRPITLRIEN